MCRCTEQIITFFNKTEIFQEISMPMKSIEEILNDDVKLPSLPSIALRIIEAVKTDEASVSEMAKIVS